MTVKILVVDDEPSLRSIIQQKFRAQIKSGEMTFVFASNGVEALTALNDDDAIGIVLTDINMPEMDGLTLLGKLSTHDRMFRTVVVSAYGDMANIRTAMNRGASDFITKPINLQDLELTIIKTIEQYVAIKKGITAQYEMVEFAKELDIERNIQQSFLPHDFTIFPNDKRCSAFGLMTPAREVGGDLFDFFKLDDHRVAFTIGDVSGKGMPAALFMAITHTLMRAIAVKAANIIEAVRQVNHQLCYNNTLCMFVTTFVGVLDVDNGTIRYCNGGHNPPYILSKDGSLKKIGLQEGIALGVIDDLGETETRYQEKSVQLQDEDIFFLYTDGVTEANNAKNEMYLEERLETYLKTAASKSVEELVRGVEEDVKKFVSGAKQSDDITIFCLKYQKEK
jgi:sigma-B regulation protein RsbU (phosphoserine phosphatase)